MASPIAEQQTSRTARSIWLDKPMKKSSTGGRAASLTSAGPSADDGNAVVSPASCAALSQIPSRTSSAAGSRPPSTAAVAFQQASEAYHEALMEKRLELVQQMQAALTDTSTVACQSIAAYSHCLEGQLPHAFVHSCYCWMLSIVTASVRSLTPRRPHFSYLCC